MSAFQRFSVQSVAVAVVLDGERTLVGRRRRGSHLEGMLEFPGGKVVRGESPEAAAVRELREETGLVARVERCLRVQQYDYGDRVVRLHFMLCRIVEGELDEATGFTWQAVADLDPCEFPAANATLLQWLQSGDRSLTRPEDCGD